MQSIRQAEAAIRSQHQRNNPGEGHASSRAPEEEIIEIQRMQYVSGEIAQ